MLRIFIRTVHYVSNYRLLFKALLKKPFQSIFWSTHCRVFDTAWERDSTALSAGVEVRAVEVDVQVPVIRSVSAAAGPLISQQQELKDATTPYKPVFINKEKKM